MIFFVKPTELVSLVKKVTLVKTAIQISMAQSAQEPENNTQF